MLIVAYPGISLLYYGAINELTSDGEHTQSTNYKTHLFTVVAQMSNRNTNRTGACATQTKVDSHVPIQILTVPVVAYHCNDLLYNGAVLDVYTMEMYNMTDELITVPWKIESHPYP